MPWVIVWTLLVLGAGVTGFLVVRSTFRSGKALLAEVSELGQLVGSAADRAAVGAQAVTAPAPVVLDDAGPARRRRAATRALRDARRRRRAVRHEAAYRRWWSFVR